MDRKVKTSQNTHVRPWRHGGAVAITVVLSLRFPLTVQSWSGRVSYCWDGLHKPWTNQHARKLIGWEIEPVFHDASCKKNACFAATLTQRRPSTARKELICFLKGQRLRKKFTYQKSIFILISHLKTIHSWSVTYNGLFGHCAFSYSLLHSIYGDVYDVKTWMMWDYYATKCH